MKITLLSIFLSICCLSAASPAAKKPTVLKNAAAPRYFAAALGVGHLTNSTDPKFREIAAAGEVKGGLNEFSVKD